MPGTIPATSQLDRLISMTAINVLAGSRAMRDRLKSFNVCMGSSIGSQRTMDAISTPPPHSIFHASAVAKPTQPSAYWGDEKIWSQRANNHNGMFDKSGRVWFAAAVRGFDNP